MALTDEQIAKVATDHGFEVLERISTQLRATGQADVAGRVDFVSMIFRCALSAQPAKPSAWPRKEGQYCNYPNCLCTRLHPADPEKCARGWPHKPAITETRVIELAKLCSDVNKDHRNRLEFSFDDLGLFKFAALIAAEGRVK